MKTEGYDNARQFAYACKDKAVTNNLFKLQAIKWEEIESGSRIPQTKNLFLVDEIFPESSNWFLNGPYSWLPLWDILEGDRKTCRDWVSHVLKLNFNNDFSGASWEDRSFTLSELVMTKDSFQYFLEGESVFGNENFVACCYETQDVDNKQNARLDFSVSSICSMIAMFHIGVQTENLRVILLMEYIIEGLEISHAIENEFLDELGKSIRDYSEKTFRIRYATRDLVDKK
jgi:hypothetical protein